MRQTSEREVYLVGNTMDDSLVIVLAFRTECLQGEFVMQEFHGDLLIGGMRLKDVHGELDKKQPSGDCTDYMLSGQLHLPPEQLELIQLNREYRIQLEDGRGGQVVVSRIATEREDELLADFAPPENSTSPRAK